MPMFPNRLRHHSGVWMSLDSSRMLVSAKEPDAAAKALRDAGLELEASDALEANRNRVSRDQGPR